VKRRAIVLLKLVVWIACLAPLLRLLYRGFNDDLGANPIEFITLSTGTWTLVLLLATLSITPLRKITRQGWLIRFRRLLGLFAFFYGCLHFTTFVWLDKFFDYEEMLEDVVKRPFITAGFLAFLLLIPLAATSTSWAIRKMGRKWQWLHRLIYLSAISGVVHFWWKVKADIREPAIYAAVLALLLSIRIVLWGIRFRAPDSLGMRRGNASVGIRAQFRSDATDRSARPG
jgi:sulfoxide reductase heme-binding subunit YedZ